MIGRSTLGREPSELGNNVFVGSEIGHKYSFGEILVNNCRLFYVVIAIPVLLHISNI
jgi:hypothetical protein